MFYKWLFSQWIWSNNLRHLTSVIEMYLVCLICHSRAGRNIIWSNLYKASTCIVHLCQFIIIVIVIVIVIVIILSKISIQYIWCKYVCKYLNCSCVQLGNTCNLFLFVTRHECLLRCYLWYLSIWAGGQWKWKREKKRMKRIIVCVFCVLSFYIFSFLSVLTVLCDELNVFSSLPQCVYPLTVLLNTLVPFLLKSYSVNASLLR